ASETGAAPTSESADSTAPIAAQRLICVTSMLTSSCWMGRDDREFLPGRRDLGWQCLAAYRQPVLAPALSLRGGSYETSQRRYSGAGGCPVDHLCTHS